MPLLRRRTATERCRENPHKKDKEDSGDANYNCLKFYCGGYMKRINLVMVLICIIILFTSCTISENVSKNAIIKEQVLTSGSEDSSYVELNRVKANIWVHTTYTNYNGYRTPSNGLVIETSDGLVMIDTPWNNAQTKELIKLTKDKFNKDFSLAIITHAHEDRMGGIDTLLENEIDARSTMLTAELAEGSNFKRPTTSLDSNPNFKIGDVAIETFYPGEGHSADNIVVWLPNEKVLFGGCIIKDLNSEGLGSTTDANVEQWPISLNKLLEKYSDADVVIPGHGKWGDIELIKHTLELLK